MTNSDYSEVKDWTFQQFFARLRRYEEALGAIHKIGLDGFNGEGPMFDPDLNVEENRRYCLGLCIGYAGTALNAKD